jgi:hypothetical protein
LHSLFPIFRYQLKIVEVNPLSPFIKRLRKSLDGLKKHEEELDQLRSRRERKGKGENITELIQEKEDLIKEQRHSLKQIALLMYTAGLLNGGYGISDNVWAKV